MPFYEIWVTERHNGLHAVKGFSPLWIYWNISSHGRGWSTTGRKRLIANGQWIMRLPIGLCWARSWQTFVQNTPYTRSNSWTTPRLLQRFIQKVTKALLSFIWDFTEQTFRRWKSANSSLQNWISLFETNITKDKTDCGKNIEDRKLESTF